MSKEITSSYVFEIMEEWAPKHLAYDWDNIGLQIGSFHKPIRKIMVTLDVLESVVDEAVEKEVDLIIAHHPLLFKPLKQVNTDSAQGRTICKLLQNNITVYASHTNLDAAQGGVNDMLFDLLDIPSREPLIKTYEEKNYKIAVYVPSTHADSVRDALGEAGAGYVGKYSHCAFQTEGQGTFRPLEGTNPFIGSQDKLEAVEEVRIETIVPETKQYEVIQAIVQAHPYEEVAYDIYPLQNSGQIYGIGRVGNLNKEITLQELCAQVKTVFDVPHVRVTGDLDKMINKIAILGGSGEKYIGQAKQMGADAYITGDMTFHPAQDAHEMGLSIIDAGHYIEKVMKSVTKQYLDNELQGCNIDVIVSEMTTDPFLFM